MRRCSLLAIVVAVLVAAPAQAKPPRTGAIVPAGGAGAHLLNQWWAQPLSRSSEDPANPFIVGGCVMLRNKLALDYGGECTVPEGTRIFEVGFTTECSNIEPEPYHADTPAEARACGLANDDMLSETTFTLDGGAPVSLLDGRFGTFMTPGRVVLPENPIFGGEPGSVMRFGGHGYVAMIENLAPGTHTLALHADGTIPDAGLPADFETTIVVTPR